MLSITLPIEMEARLEALARKSGHSVSSLAAEVICERIGDLEASHCPVKRSEGTLRGEWNEAVADDSEGLDPEPVFDRLHRKYSAFSESPSS